MLFVWIITSVRRCCYAIQRARTQSTLCSRYDDEWTGIVNSIQSFIVLFIIVHDMMRGRAKKSAMMLAMDQITAKTRESSELAHELGTSTFWWAAISTRRLTQSFELYIKQLNHINIRIKCENRWRLYSASILRNIHHLLRSVSSLSPFCCCMCARRYPFCWPRVDTWQRESSDKIISA